MIPVLSTFDPLVLLGKNDISRLNENERRRIQRIIENKFLDYLVIKLSEELDRDQLEEVLDMVNSEQRLKVLKKYIPSLDQKISENLEEFKQIF